LEHVDLWLISVGSHYPDRGQLVYGTQPVSHGKQKGYAVITPDARMLNGEVVDETLTWAALADDEPGSPRRVWRLLCLRTASDFTRSQSCTAAFFELFRRHISAI